MIHYLKGIPLDSEIPNNINEIVLGAGCFWGVEKKFWDIPGVYLTSVGYSGGDTENPSYEDVCYKNTNNVEVVKINFDNETLKLEEILKIFWECHDPTQGMRQGNDIGTQYRSIIITTNEKQFDLAKLTKNKYEELLQKSGFPKITTEIKNFKNFYYAEEYHQQYLLKNPNGYCGIGGCNVTYNN